MKATTPKDVKELARDSDQLRETTPHFPPPPDTPMPEEDAAPTMKTVAFAQPTPLPLLEMKGANKRVCRVIHVYSSIVEDLEAMKSFNAYVGALVNKGEGLLLIHGSEVYLHDWLGRVHANRAVAQAMQPMDLASMVLCGLVNVKLVASLNTQHIPAVGVSGVDLGVMQADFLNKELLGRIGGPPHIAADYIQELIERKRVPVLAPIGLGPDGQPILIRAPLVSQMFAVELGANILDFVLKDSFGASGACVLTKSSIKNVGVLIRERQFDSHLIPKLHASVAAISSGVEEVIFGTVQEKLATV